MMDSWRQGADHERNNLGFSLYRPAKAHGPKTQINGDLIPTLVPPGRPFGAVYSYRDRTLKRGIRYFYWLEDVSIYGQAEVHSPVAAWTN
jgi:hypothetical protein